MLKEITAVKTPTSETTPSYVSIPTRVETSPFGGETVRVRHFGGIGNNTISFNTLKNRGPILIVPLRVWVPGWGKVSSPLNVTEFKNGKQQHLAIQKLDFPEVYIVGSAVKKKMIQYEFKRKSGFVGFRWET
ncbi:MAG: hypothetical protein CM15mP45_04530 [Deltaproteobacteria bacterium]|nr:MAG: hypothetical protein CM15mP45_04530 [Deltaproteobacteria bacterium]